MLAQPSRDTGPELVLRRLLHARGLRFRVHRRLINGSARTTDIVFGPARVAVYVDGCFWHGCPIHYGAPSVNQGYWGPKIEKVRRRDRDTDSILATQGWEVVRIWEHDPMIEAAARIEQLVTARRLT